MSKQLVTVPSDASVVDSTRLMRDHDIGPVLVMEGDRPHGIVTDRDIVVRAVAEGRDPISTPVSEVFTRNPVTVTPDQSVDDVVRIVREQNVRRVPVVQNGRPVGVVSLGDLAIERDEDSALADIASEPPNN